MLVLQHLGDSGEPDCYLRVPDGPGPAGLAENGAGFQAEGDTGAVPGHGPGALGAHVGGGERGERVEVGQAGGAPAQLIADRGAFLPAPGGLQGGAQRRELLAQGGGFSADLGGERDQEFIPAVTGEPSVCARCEKRPAWKSSRAGCCMPAMTCRATVSRGSPDLRGQAGRRGDWRRSRRG